MKKNKKYAISWESNVQDTFSCFPNVWIQLAYAFSSRNQNRRGGYYPPAVTMPKTSISLCFRACFVRADDIRPYHWYHYFWWDMFKFFGITILYISQGTAWTAICKTKSSELRTLNSVLLKTSSCFTGHLESGIINSQSERRWFKCPGTGYWRSLQPSWGPSTPRWRTAKC